MKYKRKTKDVWYIYCCNGFRDSWFKLPINCKDEDACDKKLKLLRDGAEYSRKNPILSPFAWMSSYKKVKKHIKPTEEEV